MLSSWILSTYWEYIVSHWLPVIILLQPKHQCFCCKEAISHCTFVVSRHIKFKPPSPRQSNSIKPPPRSRRCSQSLPLRNDLTKPIPSNTFATANSLATICFPSPRNDYFSPFRSSGEEKQTRIDHIILGDMSDSSANIRANIIIKFLYWRITTLRIVKILAILFAAQTPRLNYPNDP